MIDPYVLDQFSKSVRSAFDAAQCVGISLTSFVEIEGEIKFGAHPHAVHAAEVACVDVSRALEYLSPIIRWPPSEFWEQPPAFPQYFQIMRFKSSNLTRCTAEFSRVCQGAARVGCVTGTSFHDAAMRWTCRCIEHLWPLGFSYSLPNLIRAIATKEEDLLRSSFDRLPSLLFDHLYERDQFVDRALEVLGHLYSNNEYPFFSYSDLSAIESHLEKEYYSLELHHVDKANPPDAALVPSLMTPSLSINPTVNPESPAGPPPCPVVLQGDGKGVIVLGEAMAPLTSPRYEVIKALVEVYPDRLNGPNLVKKSGRSGAVKTLKAVRKLHDQWARVIDLPGPKYDFGYGLIHPET